MKVLLPTLSIKSYLANIEISEQACKCNVEHYKRKTIQVGYG